MADIVDGAEFDVESSDVETTEEVETPAEEEVVEETEESDESEEIAAPEEDADSEESEEETEEEAEETEPKEEAKDKKPAPAPQKHKVKIDGKEQEVTTEELVKSYQRVAAVNKRFEEVATAKKAVDAQVAEVQEFVKTLKSDPLSILLDDRVMGPKAFQEIAEAFLLEQIKLEDMDPRERAIMEREQKLTRAEAEREKKLKAEEEARVEAQAKEWAKEADRKLTTALKASTLPRSPWVIGRMQDVALNFEEAGEEWTGEEVVEAVLEEFMEIQKSALSTMDPAQLESFLGKDKLDAVRKADLAKAKAKKKAPAPKVAPKAAPKKVKPKFLGDRDLEAQIAARLR